jgi:hypothetical protein
MDTDKRVQVMRNIFVLTALIGLVLFSWLLGHILRYSIPTLWHLPIQQTDPHIKNGDEFEVDGIRHLAVLPGLAPVTTQVQFEPNAEQAAPPEECLSFTYYTSLPAKCWTSDGRFVRVGGVETNVFVIPREK